MPPSPSLIGESRATPAPGRGRATDRRGGLHARTGRAAARRRTAVGRPLTLGQVGRERVDGAPSCPMKRAFAEQVALHHLLVRPAVAVGLFEHQVVQPAANGAAAWCRPRAGGRSRSIAWSRSLRSAAARSSGVPVTVGNSPSSGCRLKAGRSFMWRRAPSTSTRHSVLPSGRWARLGGALAHDLLDRFAHVDQRAQLVRLATTRFDKSRNWPRSVPMPGKYSTRSSRWPRVSTSTWVAMTSSSSGRPRSIQP